MVTVVLSAGIKNDAGSRMELVALGWAQGFTQWKNLGVFESSTEKPEAAENLKNSVSEAVHAHHY